MIPQEKGGVNDQLINVLKRVRDCPPARKLLIPMSAKAFHEIEAEHPIISKHFTKTELGCQS